MAEASILRTASPQEGSGVLLEFHLQTTEISFVGENGTFIGQTYEAYCGNLGGIHRPILPSDLQEFLRPQLANTFCTQSS